MFYFFCTFEPNKLTIMPLSYTYTKNRDIHTLKNNELISVNYKIYRVECNASTVIKEGTLFSQETTVLNFVLDGVYSIKLITSQETTTVPDILITKNLRDSIVTLAEKILCGCSKCNDCEECNTCEDYLKILVKSIALNQIAYPKYSEAIQNIMTLNNCIFTESVLLCLKNEKIYGNADVKDSLLQIISFYYLSFYAVDLDEASQENKDYITETYKFSKIAKCIRRLGVLELPSVSSPSIFNSVFNSIFN